MQGGRGRGDPFFGFGDPFAGFGGFGGQRSLLSTFLGGRDPFDDPFFTRPFGVSGGKEKRDNPRKHGRSSKEPYVEDPDDVAEERKSKQIQHRNEFNRVNNTHSHPQARSFTFQSSTVTYGGSNGAYYTKSKTMRTGSDGLTIEESKEADSATGQAAHKLSRGIHHKGHTVARKLNSDGRVDTMQTLHNLDEGELPIFEEAWKRSATKQLPGWSERINVHDGSGGSMQNDHPSRGGWALPSTEDPHYTGSTNPDFGDMAGPSISQQPGMIRADMGIGSGSGRGRSRAAATSRVDKVRKG